MIFNEEEFINAIGPSLDDRWKSPWDEAEFQKELFEVTYRPMSASERHACGLTPMRVLLSENRRFQLWRNIDSAYIIDKQSGIEYPIPLRDGTKDRDKHKRFKACKKALSAVPGLKGSLARTGLFKSVRAEGSNIYLARLSAAIAGHYVKWDTSLHPDDRLNVHHVSMNCSDDRAGNLQVLTAKKHRDVEFEVYCKLVEQLMMAA